MDGHRHSRAVHPLFADRIVKPQPLDQTPAQDVFRQNFVNILAVHIGVPYAFRVDDQYRTFRAAIHTAGGVDADLARHRQSQRLDPLFGIVAHGTGAVLLATGPVTITLVDTKKHMLTIVHATPAQEH